MRKIVAAFLMLSLSILAISAATAGDDGAKKKRGKGKFGKFDAEAVFKKLDTDGNGKLSKDEYLKMADRAKDTDRADKMRSFLGKSYDKISAGSADGITLDQFKKARENRGGQFKRGKKKAENKSV